MKSIFIKSLLTINLFFLYNCKAQTANDYIAFYNDVVPKLNTIIPNKTQFYGNNFSYFYNELLNKNINITRIGVDSKIDNSKNYHILSLNFSERNLSFFASENEFQYPRVWITFETEIQSPEIINMIKQYNGEWNYNFLQFFSNMKIEKIVFAGINGYNSQDRSLK